MERSEEVCSRVSFKEGKNKKCVPEFHLKGERKGKERKVEGFCSIKSFFPFWKELIGGKGKEKK